MRNRTFILILSLILSINLVACTKSQTTNEVPEFADKEWVFYDEGAGEHLCMNIRSDGSYSYHCQCGEPVGDSDLYERYTYNADEGIITLSNDYDKNTAEIKVLSFNDYHLMLEIDGEVKDFILEEMDIFSNFFSFEGGEYFSEYDTRCTIIEMKDNKIVYGPVGYDPEGIYEDGPFEEFELSEDAAFAELSIQSFNSIQGDAEYEEFYETSYREFDQEEAKEILEYGSALAFVWFDDDLKVEKILYFGHTSVTADYIAITVEPEDAEGITRERLDKEIEQGYYDAAHINVEGTVIYLLTQEQLDALPEGVIKK